MSNEMKGLTCFVCGLLLLGAIIAEFKMGVWPGMPRWFPPFQAFLAGVWMERAMRFWSLPS